MKPNRCIDNTCGYFDWYVQSSLRVIKYCKKKQRRIKNPKIIPSWCPLEDMPEDKERE